MRSDLHEVLIERPRNGWRLKTHRGNKPLAREWSGSEDDYADSYQPRQRRDRFFNDLLSPLRRWLRTQVGRPWDKVWSELSNGIDARTVVGQHLLEHVLHEVSLHCVYDAASRQVLYGGQLAQYRNRRGVVEGLYVDPRHGLLCWRQPLPRRERQRMRTIAAPPATVLWYGQRFLTKREGIWFVAQATPWLPPRDHDLPCDFTWKGQHYRIVKRQQMNSRELRAAGLKNDNA